MTDEQILAIHAKYRYATWVAAESMLQARLFHLAGNEHESFDALLDWACAMYERIEILENMTYDDFAKIYGLINGQI